MNYFDTPEWRDERDQKLLEWTGDQAAADLILMIGNYIAILVKLSEEPEAETPPEDLRSLFQIPFVLLPQNPFWIVYQKQLSPILWVNHNTWLDAKSMEESASVAECENPATALLPFSYSFRFYYIELLLYVIYLLRGDEYVRQVDMDVRKFFSGYAKTLQEYGQGLKEKKKPTEPSPAT